MIPDADISNLAAATARLNERVDGLEADVFGGPSLLPGWTRAHVLSHLARNADGMRNLLLSARTREPFGLYASKAVRDADIEVGASRPPAVIRDDVTVAAARLAAEIAVLPEDAWSVEVGVAPGVPNTPRFPAATIVAFRLFELEVHQVDLAAGYKFADVPVGLRPAFIRHAIGLLGDRAPSARLESTDSDGTWDLGSAQASVTVSGTSADLLGWLLGRTDGSDLHISGAGAVPPIPNLT